MDPKLFLGVLLVLGSMALGARLIGQADQTTTVYVAKQNLPANAPVTEEDLSSTEVRFPSQEDSDRYIYVEDDIPKGARTDREIGAGELVPKKALTNGEAEIVEFGVRVTDMPKGLKANDLVSVLLVPREDSQDATTSPQAQTWLQNAVVVATPAEGGGVSGSQSVTLRVNLAEAEGFSLEEFYGATSIRDVVLTRTPLNAE